MKLGSNRLKDFKENKTNIEHYEFIYKTGYCQNCLIKLGYCD